MLRALFARVTGAAGSGPRFAVEFRDRPDRTVYVMLSDHYAGTGPDTARELQALLAEA